MCIISKAELVLSLDYIKYMENLMTFVSGKFYLKYYNFSKSIDMMKLFDDIHAKIEDNEESKFCEIKEFFFKSFNL